MEKEKPAASSDEVDVGQLFARIGDFFASIWFSIMRLLAWLRRLPLENKFLFGSVIAVTMMMGLAYSYFLAKSYYESTMILSSNYLNKRLVENTVDKLNLLAAEPEKQGLARTLHIPDTLAKKIIGFEARPFVSESDLIELEVLKEQLRTAQASGTRNEKVIEQVVMRIEIENRHAFEITVRTLAPSTVGLMQTALVDFFRNNPYIRKRIDINKAILQERKQKLSSELDKLDSLKYVIYENYRNMAAQSRAGSNNVILSDKAVTNPIEVFNQDLEFYNLLQVTDRDIYLQPDFEIVDGFTEFSEPASASTAVMLLFALLTGVGFAYLLVVLRHFNHYLANIE